jgi:hypothetical protein
VTVSKHSRGSHFVQGLQCAECQQPMPNRTGLLSHGRSKHPGIDPYKLAERSYANLPKISPTPPPKTLPPPPVLETHHASEGTDPEEPVQLNEHGVPACPECGKFDFRRKTAWGMHRRLEHKIFGSSKASVAAREKKEALEKAAAKAARAAAKLAKQQSALPASPTKSPTALANTFACDICGREGFISKHGVAIHKAQAHPSVLTKQTPKGELVNGHAKKDRIVEPEFVHQLSETETDGQSATHQQITEALIIAHTTGELKGFIKSIAEKHDFPTRLFTLRCAQSLLGEAKR